VNLLTQQQYVVVQTVTTLAGPDLHVSKPVDRDAALRIFTGVVESARPVFHPHSSNRIRVIGFDEWCRLEALALGLAEALVGPDTEGNPS
jgi:hypothetical protein